MGFEPGHNFATGRPKGSRNRRTAEFLNAVDEHFANGGKRGITRILELVQSEDEGVAFQASAWLEKTLGLPYIPREDRVPVPRFQTIEEAEAFLVDIAMKYGEGEIASDTATSIATLVRIWISVKQADIEIELKKIHIDGPGDQTIRIEGGLPVMPGLEDVIMPQLNGSKTNGHALEPPAPQIESSATESVSEEPETKVPEPGASTCKCVA